MPGACLSNAFAASYDPQSACPLFSRIPPEIRNSIFKLALTEYDDTGHPYEQSAVYCRPDYRFRHRIDTDLLRTCRRTYLEAHLLPVAINEHVFWCYRGPPGVIYAADPHGYFETMTSQQRDAVDCVHFFTQQLWLEGQFRDACRSPLMRPRKLKITLRHTDWWLWEYRARLGIDPRLAGRVPWNEMGREPRVDEVQLGFGYQFRHLRGLQELEMEFETIKSKLTELEAIVQRALAWKFDLRDGNVLSTEGTAVVRRLWRGRDPWRQHNYMTDAFMSAVSEEDILDDGAYILALNETSNLNVTPNSETTEEPQMTLVFAQESAIQTNSSYPLHSEASNVYQEAGQSAGRGTHQASPPSGTTEEAPPAETTNGSNAVQTRPETNELHANRAGQPVVLGRDQRSYPANIAYFVFNVTWRARPPASEPAAA